MVISAEKTLERNDQNRIPDKNKRNNVDLVYKATDN